MAEKLDVFMIIHLDNILIYTDDARPGHVETMQSVFMQLKKHLLYNNLKKCRLY